MKLFDAITVFVSYKSEHRNIATRVRDTLQSWGYVTWFDQDNIPKGEYFRDAIQAGLEESDIVIGIVTSEALQSREVLTEWDYAFSGNARLLLLRYGDVDLPYWLAGIQYIDCTVDEHAGLIQLKQALALPDTSTTTLSKPLPDYIRRYALPGNRPQYQPPKPQTDETTQQRRKIAWMLFLILTIVTGITYFAFNERIIFLISTIIALIPAIIALMPQNQELKYLNSGSDQPINENREKMLYNVYQTWIQGVLYPNLPMGAINLGISLKPDTVLRHADYADYALPDSVRDIEQVFTDMKGELLILGDPGSGKTILLLQLAEYLLGRAQYDEKQPMPAVFNLSSWGRERKPLAEWLIDEMRRGYGIPKKIGNEWIERGKLTLLLDGLDEIAPTTDLRQIFDSGTGDERANQIRSECIDAINTYRIEHKNVDIAVCSRIRDYEVLQNKLDLNAAIVLGELTDAQISMYLAGDEHVGTRELVQTIPYARQMAETPFLLTMMKAAYVHIPYEGSPHNQLKLDDENLRQSHLLNEYIEGQLRQHEHPMYTHKETMNYLRWLAHRMLLNKISIFYIEDIQPSWCNKIGKYNLIIGLIGGLNIGLVFGLIAGLIAGIITGLIIGFESSLKLSLIGGTIGGTLIGTLLGMLTIKETSSYGIEFAERFSWSFSRSHFRYVFYTGLIGGPVIGLIGGSVVAISSGSNMNLLLIFLIGSFAGLVGGMVFGLIGGLIFGMSVNLESQKHIEIRTKPNMGLQLSIKNSLRTGLIAAVVVGAIFSLSGNIYLVLISGLLYGIVIGLAYGGGMPIIQHIILRWLLSSECAIPFGRYDRFLDFCAMMGVLRKVGGGYMFRHRILLEYFSKQYENKLS